MRILITGSRDFQNKDLIKSAILEYVPPEKESETTIVHGGANGADALAGQIAQELGMNTEVHQADWKRFGKMAGPMRNQQMVNKGADICLAFPLSNSIGTWDCARKADLEKINVVIFEEMKDCVLRRKFRER